MEPNSFRSEIPDKEWYTALENLTQWPFQFYWYNMEEREDLVVVFADDPKEEFDTAAFLDNFTAEDNTYHLGKIRRAQTFKGFENRIESSECKSLDGSLEKIGVYDHVDFYGGYHVKKKNLPLNLCPTGVDTGIIALMGQIVNILTERNIFR